MSNILLGFGIFVVILIIVSITASSCKISSESEFAAYKDYVNMMKQKRCSK